MKNSIKRIVYYLLRKIAILAYPSVVFEGKYFGTDGAGWFWVYKALWTQKILGFNRNIPFPVIPHLRISNPDNLIIGKDNLNNFQSPGVYFQNFSERIILGDSVYIGPNVGIITANHDFKSLDTHMSGKAVQIGSNCWIGMNSVIMPGVILGPRTIVGAGSIVTKSFEKGNIIIAGNPAKYIKDIT